MTTQTKKHNWIARLLRMLLLIIIVWLLWIAAVWSLQHRIMFPRGMIEDYRIMKSTPPGIESIWLDTADGNRVEAWLMPAEGLEPDQPAPIVFFAHGNGEVIDDNLDLQWLAESGTAVALIEYRGYGRSSGSPSQRAIVADTVQLVEQILKRTDIDETRVGYLGRSIGTGVLSQVARTHPPNAMAMIVPPARLDTMAWKFGVPPFMVRSPFRTDLAVQEVDMPILILTRDRDQIIPPQHASMLDQLAPDSRLVTLRGTHNWLDDDDEMRRERAEIRQFLEAHDIVTR
ncbi:MAG: hypothetical protein CMJ39_08460 [Phycisphaerae bacterium]|nr:hypothetical protein [Phycisphaerae bacterium]|tara:strand:+ start:1510 stop:2370 length:861 start_codon:yes stop_codon:yes gene_type:complete